MANSNSAALLREFQYAKNFLSAIIDRLKVCDEYTNLTKEIGVYAQTMPQFRLLAGKSTDFLMGVRKICTGEMSVKEGLEFFRKEYDLLNEAIETASKS